MTVDRPTLHLAARTLDPELFAVWTLHHLQGYGRRAGARFLGITEDAWRHRLRKAEVELDRAIERQARKEVA